ncbi:helix-turn-helix domain-containing protein [Nonomuraea lactucae]|uniref:helix-turn-helix domain-containing protein n=1 Tax=Nonomuraea lactucae TaxID=2249762 RepID=UPI000DE39311|nr:helix-turn-helix domain-containing protein [Nonomuraea lactucae]
MPAPAPLSDDERQQIRDLHAAGHGCNAIARQLGRDRATISKHAKDLGLSFDRTQTKAATEARIADAKHKRALLADQLLDDALRLRTQLWEPCKVYNFGGRDNTYAEAHLDHPDFAGQEKILRSLAVAVDKHARLIELDRDPEGLAAVDVWLRGITGQ